MAAPEKPRHPAGRAAGAGGLAPPGKRINLQLLTYLDALMTELHVTRAADRVGIGQSAMSLTELVDKRIIRLYRDLVEVFVELKIKNIYNTLISYLKIMIIYTNIQRNVLLF